MENFIYDIPTKVYFGKQQIQHLGEIASECAKKVLLVYGGGSIKKNGIYQDAVAQLEQSNNEYFDLSGVEPNPRVETVRKGVALCREHQIDAVIAIGGGSCVDCAKVISAGVYYDGDVWDFTDNPNLITKTLPVIAIITLSATGSEMDGIAVISDMNKCEKKPIRNLLMRPKYAILDPTYTFTVSKYQTAAGAADILSHLMESYFSNQDAYMQKAVAEALMKTVIKYGPIAYEEPESYEARANLMWASTWAINDFLKYGNTVAWSVHAIEHQLSAFYDITHGIGLAILTPSWMKYIMNDKTIPDFAKFARNVWGIEEQDDKKAAYKGIEALQNFYACLNIPKTLQEVGIQSSEHFEVMAKQAVPYLNNNYYPLNQDDIVQIYKDCFQEGE